MINKEEIVEIGKFQKTHALKGELNAIITVMPEYFTDNNPAIIELDGLLIPFYTSSVRPKGNTTFLLKLDGINDSEEASKFVNKTIYALKDKLKAFYEEEGYDLQDEDSFIGFKIEDKSSGNIIGEIEDIDDSTVNILMHVKSPEGDKVFIPFVEDWIFEIDNDKRRMIMDFPEGLIDLNMKTKIR